MARASWRVHRGVLVGLLAVGLTACAAGGPPAARPAGSRSASPTPTTGTPAAAAPAATTVIDIPIRWWRRLPPSPPVRVEIPAIGVSSSLVRLGFNQDGTMEVPGQFELAGWFTGGPEPGQLGPAVIAGHVDSRTGPAVFSRLGELRAGDQIRVVRADRRVVEFEVESLSSYPKQALPDERVYGGTTAPSLRLITCAGTFDRSKRSYRDNLVVSAKVTGEPEPASGKQADR